MKARAPFPGLLFALFFAPLLAPLLSAFFALGLYALFPQQASAHENRPVYLELRELAPNRYSAHLRTPPTLSASSAPRIVAPDFCREEGAGRGRLLLLCGQDLSNGTITLAWPGANPSLTAMIRLQRASGETHAALLPPGETRWRPPPPESADSVFGQYLALGFNHILGGLDHLLFVACLVWLMRSPRRMLLGVTGFTLAHSATLALAALGLARAPVAATEAAIALSIVFLAAEIASDRRDTLTRRYPILVAGGFGLLHGLGFASALRETGLPQVEVLSALVAFNIGVELGQIAFLLLLLAGFALAARARIIEFAKAAHPASYVIGVIAAYWTLQRLAAL